MNWHNRIFIVLSLLLYIFHLHIVCNWLVTYFLPLITKNYYFRIKAFFRNWFIKCLANTKRNLPQTIAVCVIAIAPRVHRPLVNPFVVIPENVEKTQRERKKNRNEWTKSFRLILKLIKSRHQNSTEQKNLDEMKKKTEKMDHYYYLLRKSEKRKR